jgi:hypothetical protein
LYLHRRLCLVLVSGGSKSGWLQGMDGMHMIQMHNANAQVHLRYCCLDCRSAELKGEFAVSVTSDNVEVTMLAG